MIEWSGFGPCRLRLTLQVTKGSRMNGAARASYGTGGEHGPKVLSPTAAEPRAAAKALPAVSRLNIRQECTCESFLAISTDSGAGKCGTDWTPADFAPHAAPSTDDR